MAMATEAKKSGSPDSGERRRVMIVDGNKSRLKDLIDKLESSGIAVTQVVARNDIMSRAAGSKPEVILMNLFFDGASTMQLVRDLRTTLEKDPPRIIIMTSHYSKENIMECIKNGASDFIIEPFESDVVLQRIKYQLQDRKTIVPEELNLEPAQIAAGFQLLYDCLRILAEVKDIHLSIHECLKHVSALSNATRVNIFLADLEKNQAQVMASSDDPKIDNLGVELEKYPEIREVMLNGSILYIKDITQNPLTKDIKAQVKTIDIVSILVFPIRHRQETIGTLNIRLGKGGMDVSDKHLKTFYMIALSLGSKLAAKRLLKRIGT